MTTFQIKTEAQAPGSLRSVKAAVSPAAVYCSRSFSVNGRRWAPLRRDRCYHTGQLYAADKAGGSVLKEELLTVIAAYFSDVLWLNGAV